MFCNLDSFELSVVGVVDPLVFKNVSTGWKINLVQVVSQRANAACTNAAFTIHETRMPHKESNPSTHLDRAPSIEWAKTCQRTFVKSHL